MLYRRETNTEDDYAKAARLLPKACDNCEFYGNEPGTEKKTCAYNLPYTDGHTPCNDYELDFFAYQDKWCVSYAERMKNIKQFDTPQA